MYDFSPGWHTTINPFYFITAKLLSILAIIMLLSFIAIKVFKIKKERYQGPVNTTNLIFCILSTLLLVCYFAELIKAWYSGYAYEQFSFYNPGISHYWILYVGLMWLPLLLTQLFWRKNNRVNINLALFIIFMFNLHLWIEWISIFANTLIKQ